MSAPAPIAIYGSGGFAREVLELLRDINQARGHYEILGFLDDREAKWGEMVNDVPILGGADWLGAQATPPLVAIGIGSPASKAALVERIGGMTTFPALAHPSVVMSSYVHLGRGAVITAGNILTANIRVEDFAMINLACTVGHDAVIGRYSTLAPGANVSGAVSIGEGCDVGTGSAIIQGVTVGEWSVVGAGAVVARDLPANCTAVGVPAKVIKQREKGWHRTPATH